MPIAVVAEGKGRKSASTGAATDMENQEKELRAIRGLLEEARERIDRVLLPTETLAA